MRILILGGTGFIGSSLARLLISSGHLVAVFHRGETPAELPPGVEHLSGDRDRLLDYALTLRRFAPQVVVHSIAYVEVHARQMLEVFRGFAERSVVISSGDVYRSYGVFRRIESGACEPLPSGEEAPLRHTLYPYRALSKGPDDFLFSYDKIPVENAAQGDSSLPSTVLRLPMVYGPCDPLRRMAAYVRQMIEGQSIISLDEKLAGWRCTRGYVEDVAAAIALAIMDARAAGRTYNVGEQEARSEADWVRAIGMAAGWKGEVVTVPGGSLPEDYRQHLLTDTTRIRTELGYSEIVPRDEAFARAVRWELGQPPTASAPNLATEPDV
jgi:nucleoside-diphosphate-sugar epimerase